MKKICILQNSLSHGGTDTFVINLCKGLVQDGYNVTVVLSMDKNKPGPRLNDLIETGVGIVWTCPLECAKSKINHLFLLYKILRKGEFDVFQSNIDLFNGPNMFVSWMAKVPVRVCHSHNSQQGKEIKEGRTFPVVVYQSFMRWLCWKFSNRRCGCSESALSFLFQNKWKYDSFSKVIHNGIDLQKYHESIDRELKRSSLNLSKQFTICTVGRISDQKNPEFLLDIFYELSKQRDDVELVWCGTGELESSIKEKIKIHNIENTVHLLGARDDVHEILKISDVFLLPSRFEGLGIVLIEAQAAKLTCVMSDVIPKEADCGLCHTMSLEQDASAWALAISDILDDKIAFKLDKHKLSEYSIEYMIKEMEEVFEF